MTRHALSGILILFLLFGPAGSCRAADASRPTLRVMTYNIRYDNPADSLNGWPHRRDFAANMLRYHRPQIIGMQEGLSNQLADLAERLPGYAWCGAGRDDGGTKGEYCAIFFDTSAVRLLRSSTFWLSPTPDVPSKGWDAALNRICTWAEFERRVSGERLFVFNTHFDHQGSDARAQSALLIRLKIDDIAVDKYAILLGDFNSQEADPPIQIISSAEAGRTRLTDTQTLSITPHHGPTATFDGFDVRNPLNAERIDFIFVSPGLRVLAHATLTDFKSDLHFPSDHLPVVAELELP